MANESHKTVVITGCDVPNSYGYELALCLDKQGFGVFAGCMDCNSMGARSLASRGSTKLAILQIDVTKIEEIDDARDMLKDMIGDEGIWALVNCAETYAVAEVDWYSNDDYERMMNVNFHGTVRVVKALLPLLRKAKGRIVNLSNISGCISRCGLSAFSASKFALEAFSDSLRQEMVKWGVFVSVVQPAFQPESKDLLSDPETSVRLNRLSKDVKELYGDEYFSCYIRSVSSSSKKDTEFTKSRSFSSSTDNSSSSSSRKSSVHSNASPSLKRTTANDLTRRKNSNSSLSSNSKVKSKAMKNKDNLSSTNAPIPTLKVEGSKNLSNMNRVLHALVDAVTSPSPKVRYFIGSFQDHVIKTASPMLPTVLLDNYYMSGDIGKVIPKKLKEKKD